MLGFVGYFIVWSVCLSFSPVTELQLDFGLAAEVVLPLISVSSACLVQVVKPTVSRGHQGW